MLQQPMLRRNWRVNVFDNPTPGKPVNVSVSQLYVMRTKEPNEMFFLRELCMDERKGEVYVLLLLWDITSMEIRGRGYARCPFALSSRARFIHRLFEFDFWLLCDA